MSRSKFSAPQVNRLADKLRADGLGADRLSLTIDQNAQHTEAAWAKRFPKALEFLGECWWRAPEGSGLPEGAEASLLQASGALRWLMDARASAAPATNEDAERNAGSSFFVWPEARVLFLPSLLSRCACV